MNLSPANAIRTGMAPRVLRATPYLIFRQTQMRKAG